MPQLAVHAYYYVALPQSHSENLLLVHQTAHKFTQYVKSLDTKVMRVAAVVLPGRCMWVHKHPLHIVHP